MTALTVTVKGRITLRNDLLTHLGVQPGDQVSVDKLPGGRFEIKASRPAGKISDIFNLLKKRGGPTLSIDEIDEIDKKGWAGRR